MTTEQYIQCIKVRAMCIVLQDELDALALLNPVFKQGLKRDCNRFRETLEKEMSTLYKTLPSDVIEEYNKLGNAIEYGINETIKVCIIDD